MTTRLRLLLTAVLVLLAAAPLAAGVATARDDPSRVARVSPAAPSAGAAVHLAFRARLDSYRATYVVKTAGPRPGCATRRKVSQAYVGGVATGDRIAFALRAPARGWCRGVHRVYLLAKADVDMADGNCDIVPESGSSDCPEELETVIEVDRRTRFTVR